MEKLRGYLILKVACRIRWHRITAWTVLAPCQIRSQQILREFFSVKYLRNDHVAQLPETKLSGSWPVWFTSQWNHATCMSNNTIDLTMVNLCPARSTMSFATVKTTVTEWGSPPWFGYRMFVKVQATSHGIYHVKSDNFSVWCYYKDTFILFRPRYEICGFCGARCVRFSVHCRRGNRSGQVHHTTRTLVRTFYIQSNAALLYQ